MVRLTLISIILFSVILKVKLDVKKLKESKDLVNNLANNDRDIDAAKKLKEAGVIKTSDEKINSLKKKKTDLLTGFSVFTATDGANVANAVATGVSKGLPDLVKGIKTKSWYHITIGALNLLTALTAVVGGPYGAMAGSVLSLIVTVLQIFGAPATESQEDMFRRILTDMEVEKLKTEVSGVKMYMETLQAAVAMFREPSGDNQSGKKQSEKNNLQKDEATAFFILSLGHVEIFGRLQERIEKYCFVGPVDDKTRATADLNVKRCLSLLKAYTKLTTVRQLLLAGMAGICKEANGECNLKGLKGIQETLVEMIKESQKLDEKVLGFLATPMDSVEARYTIYNLYAQPEDNMEVIEYLRRINVNADNDNQAMDNLFNADDILICAENNLQGLCQLVRKKLLVTLTNWKETKSMFIPPGLSVKAQINGNSVGPFQGLAVFSSNTKLEKMNEIRILESNGNFSASVRICTKSGWCDRIEDLASPQPLGREILHGIPMTEIESMSVPGGMKVILINDDKSKQAGPLYGDITLREMSGTKWTDIQVTASLDISSADLVLVCEKNDFAGVCLQLGPEFESDVAVKFKDLKDSSGKKILSVEKVLSMKIPAGVRVKFFAKNIMTGPYTGPLDIAKLPDVGVDAALVQNILNAAARTRGDTKKPEGKTAVSSGSEDKGIGVATAANSGSGRSVGGIEAATSGRKESVENSGSKLSGSEKKVSSSDAATSGRGRSVENSGSKISGSEKKAGSSDTATSGREKSVDKVYVLKRHKIRKINKLHHQQTNDATK